MSETGVIEGVAVRGYGPRHVPHAWHTRQLPFSVISSFRLFILKSPLLQLIALKHSFASLMKYIELTLLAVSQNAISLFPRVLCHVLHLHVMLREYTSPLQRHCLVLQDLRFHL